jgi:hypothetical protein
MAGRWGSQTLKELARRRWHAHLDAADRAGAVSGNVSAYPMLNTAIVDFIDDDAAVADDPRYTFGAVHGAYAASRYDIGEVCFLEFGTGRGGGVDRLERLAALCEDRFGVRVRVRTFDIGTGVPDTSLLADLPNHNMPGSYADFDADATRARFRRPTTELILGAFESTVGTYLARDEPPVAFIAFDTGSFSSTSQALRVIRESRREQLLPRVQCFFEPTLVYTFAWFNGDLKAVDEHNATEAGSGELGWRRPLAPIRGLRYYAPRRLRDQPWVEKYYLAHITDHPRYADPDGLLRRPPSAVL